MLGLMVLFLSSCATQTVRPDLNEADLAIFKAGLKQILKQRRIEGNIQYRDEAEGNWDLWLYGGRARDAFDLSEYDKQKALEYTEESLLIIENARKPQCKRYQIFCLLRKR